MLAAGYELAGAQILPWPIRGGLWIGGVALLSSSMGATVLTSWRPLTQTMALATLLAAYFVLPSAMAEVYQGFSPPLLLDALNTPLMWWRPPSTGQGISMAARLPLFVLDHLVELMVAANLVVAIWLRRQWRTLVRQWGVVLDAADDHPVWPPMGWAVLAWCGLFAAAKTSAPDSVWALSFAGGHKAIAFLLFAQGLRLAVGIAARVLNTRAQLIGVVLGGSLVAAGPAAWAVTCALGAADALVGFASAMAEPPSGPLRKRPVSLRVAAIVVLLSVVLFVQGEKTAEPAHVFVDAISDPALPQASSLVLIEAKIPQAGLEQFWMERYEHPSRVGELPELFRIPAQAEAACAQIGMRLCTAEQWMSACELATPGEAETGAGAPCNLSRYADAASARPRLRRAGQPSRCGDIGPKELLGNVWEIVSHPPSGYAVAGGDLRTSDRFVSCRRVLEIFPDQFEALRDQLLGARCCAAATS